MDCLEFRRRLAAEPRAREIEFVAHRDSCHDGCTEAWWRAQRLERRIASALAIEPPAGLAERILLAQATRTRVRTRRLQVGLALAASLLLAVGVGTFGWNRNAQADPLPAMSVAHLRGEAFALARTQPVSDADLRRDFAARGVDLHAMPEGAVFVRDCDVGRHPTVHLVFRINNEPVTALYFVGRSLAHARDFHHAGWQGRELPLEHGTLLLLGADARGFAQVERTLRDALQPPVQQALGEL
ncbi:MAG TPA: DUF3379 family protein [Rhodanobacteraceae bacterium]